MPARITGDFPNWHLVPAGQAFAVFAMATPELARCHTSAVVRADEMTGRLDSKHASGKLPVAPLSAVPGRFGRWREEWSPTASSAVRRFWLAQKEVHPKRNCNPARATHENLNLSQNLISIHIYINGNGNVVYGGDKCFSYIPPIPPLLESPVCI